ncbi:MAG: anti-sigma factor [Anaerolineales bacterium]|nr:anti-sigma factor [Anaerolineales bacterium]NUQ83973.1 anti-sigma factor [Anaerolineales bacterium]
MTRDEHAPFLENIPAYAIGALDADETAALASHLEGCASCRTELAEYRALGESLLTALPPRQPPAALRKRLQSRLLGAQKTKRLTFNWSFSQLATGIALVVLLAMSFYSITQMRSLQLEQARLNRQIRTGQTVMSMLSYPATERLAINSESVVGSLLLDRERNIVALIVWNMPQLDETKTYQIWLINPQDERVSAGIFRPEDDRVYTTYIVFPEQSVTDFVGVGVTIEPAGGSDQPTGERVFKVDF